jgi:hypothetical protein
MNKFEKLVEYIINEDEEKAQELFHQIVVEKSREIYNDLVSESEDQADDFVGDIEADEYGSDMHAEDEHEDDDMDDMDDMDDDQEAADDEELEDRVVDLEAELDALKAEFDAMMADDDDDGDIDGHEHDMDMDDEEEVEEELGMFEDDDEEVEDDEEIVREYVEKVAPAKGEDHKATSPVAGKNDMGGTSANIVKGGSEAGGKVKAPQQMNTGNKNVPGGNQGLEKAPAPKRGE